MKQSNYTLQVIEPSDGHTLTNTDYSIFSKKIFLAVNDSIENFFEITDEEAEKIRIEKEKQYDNNNQ